MRIWLDGESGAEGFYSEREDGTRERCEVAYLAEGLREEDVRRIVHEECDARDRASGERLSEMWREAWQRDDWGKQPDATA